MSFFQPFVLLVLGFLASAAAAQIEHPGLGEFSDNVATKMRDARAEFEAVRDPDAEDYGKLGMVYHAHRQLVPASQAYRLASSDAPYDARWLYLLARVEQDRGNSDAALRFYRRSLALNEEYLPTRIYYARLLRDGGDTKAARRVLEAASSEQPIVLAELAQIDLLDKNFAAARDRLEKVLSLQPGATRMHYLLAQVYRGLGDVERARAELAKQGPAVVQFYDIIMAAVEAESSSTALFLQRATQAAKAGDLVAAKEFVNRALANDPNDVATLGNLARIEELQGNFDRALQLLDRALAVDPDDAGVLWNKGAILEQQGNDQAAASLYRRAAAAQPDLFEPQMLLGNAAMRLDQPEEAAQAYNRAAQLRPERSTVALRAIAAELAANRCGVALKKAEELANQLRDDPSTAMLYARIVATCPRSSKDDLRQAEIVARNLNHFDPSIVSGETLAFVLAAKGDFDEALDYLAQASFVAIQQNDPQAQQRLNELAATIRNRRAPTQPLEPSSELFNPPRLTAADRR